MINIPFQSSPFLLDSKFEMNFFSAIPLIHKEFSSIYNDIYNQWTGVLIHVAVTSRAYTSYSIMRLSGDNASPTENIFKY